MNNNSGDTKWGLDSSEENMSFQYRGVPPATVEIAYEEYEKLLVDSSKFQSLMQHGVEDWQGFEKAMDNINKINFEY